MSGSNAAQIGLKSVKPRQKGWPKWRRPLLQLTCLLIGTMMLYRGILNAFFYPGNWERIGLAPAFFVGLFGIYLMWREMRLGWWIFTIANVFVGYLFVFILEDVWHHHVMPHIIFSAVFLPFYPKMTSGLPSWVGTFLMGLLRNSFIAWLIMLMPSVHRWVNSIAINRIVNVSPARPHPFSTVSSYTSWRSLTDRTWSGRHLGEWQGDQSSLPASEDLGEIFARPNNEQSLCPKSTVLFPAFAQYLTDGFLRTLPDKDPNVMHIDRQVTREYRKRNNSNHEIDMCTLYGRKYEQTLALRVENRSHSERGQLKSQFIDGEEYPRFLFEDGEVCSDFDGKLDTPMGLVSWLRIIADPDSSPQEKKFAETVRDNVFAVGGDRVNSAPQVSMINTLWLREHNRLARELGNQYQDWDDDRVFETARNIVIVQFIKVVVEDYINHIAPISLKLLADPNTAWRAHWNKPNWITTEFSLLYRWHSLVPNSITWGDQKYDVNPSYFLNNIPLISTGLARAFEDMSAQPAGKLGPRNTDTDMLEFEILSILQGRICKLQPYNEYRKYLGEKPAENFDEVSSDPSVVALLEKHYNGDVDTLDFFVGIFCEDRVKGSPLPRTILSFVALDAFSQALTNPLLSENVFAPPDGFEDDEAIDHPTFSRYGWEQIGQCKSLLSILERNVTDPDNLAYIGMTRADWNQST